MTNLNAKLTATIATLAMLAPTASAQASYRHPAQHRTPNASQRHLTHDHARRSAMTFARDNRQW